MKKSSATLIVIGAIVIAAVLVVGSLTFFKPHTSGYAVQNPSSGSSSSGTLFSQTTYYKWAYQIFPGVLSSTAKQATTGFNIQTKKNSDGTTTIKLVATNPNYKTQTYTVSSGDKVYFIERTLMDDSNNEDRFPTDDLAVVINSQGYVIQGPGSA